MTRTLLALLVLAAGCAAHDLDARWRPLRRIAQGPVPSSTAAMAVGDTVYVRDLDRWLARHPGPLLEAALAHERIHALRQAELGLPTWLGRYLTDTDFAWREEQLGWAVQLRTLQRAGHRIDPAAVARNLASYATLDVSQAEAEAWVRDVLAGRWEAP